MTNIEKILQNHHLQCCETLRKGAENKIKKSQIRRIILK